MKKQSILFSISIFCIIFSTNISEVFSESQLPNPNFDNWIDNNNAEGWNTLSLDLVFFTIHSAERTDDAAAGPHAVKLETQDVAGEFIIPGYISLGELDFENMTPYGGIPFAERPLSFGFSYKYAPVGDDFFSCFLILTKWNEDTQKRDTIGGSLFVNNTEQQGYIHQEIPIAYQSTETPDSINVGFVSSGINPQTGSTLFIDSLVLGYTNIYPPTFALPASEMEYQSFKANWIPIFGANSYTLEVAKDVDFSQLLENYEAIVIQNQFPQSNSYTVYPENPGKYYYRIRVNYDSEISDYSNIITVMMPTHALEAQNITHQSFEAHWLMAENASHYLLEVATDEQFHNTLEDYTEMHISAEENSLEVINISPATEYHYRITVVYDGQEMLLSNTINLMTQEEPEYELCLISEPEDAGVLEGSGWFIANTELSISAQPEAEYAFLYWQNSITEEKIYESEYGFIMPEYDLCFIAFFESTATSILIHEPKESVSIYPNPALDYFTLESNRPMHKIEVFSTSGQVLKELRPSSRKYTLLNTKLSPGLYILRIHTDTGTYQSKLYIKTP